MTRSASTSYLGPEFNTFLFAPIGEDRNGTLTVLSALARLDLDPWQEAANLARLPTEAAIQKLAIVIAQLDGGSSARQEPATVAARLIAFLPRDAGSDDQSRNALLGGDPIANSRAVATYMYLVVFTASVLGAQFILENRHPAVQVHNTHGVVADPAGPKVLSWSPAR